MKIERLTVNFTRPCGKVRRINGGNLGPQISHGNMNYGTTPEEDFRELEIPLTRLHDAPLGNKGMRLVDIQHIFGNWRADAQNPDNYYFQATDDYIRCIREGGSEIMFRLGTSIEHSRNNYFAFPPEDYDKWADICINIIRHYNEGWNNGFSWNIRYWEIWNEPDAVKCMWNSTMAEYCRLYDVAARKIKARFPSLKVGGPVLKTLIPGRYESEARIANMREFLEYCRSRRTPLDFFSWHRYSTALRDIVDEPAMVKALLDEYGFPETELHLNEWHYRVPGQYGNVDPVNGLFGINAAVFATAVLTAWQDTPLTMGCHYSVGPLSDAWGAWNGKGERFKLFYTLKSFAAMVHHTDRVSSSSENSNLQILAARDGDGRRAVLISDLKSGADQLDLTMTGAENTAFSLVRIDFDHDWEESECRSDGAGRIVLPVTGDGNSTVLFLRELR